MGAVALAVVVIAVLLVRVASVVAADRPSGGFTFDIEAHRGGLGLRPESSLAAFTNALRLGVTTLELDVQITKDGQPSSRTTAGRTRWCAATPVPQCRATPSSPTSANSSRT
jgi:Glycerophosphoryl diester phosphodiesterase family